MIREILRYYLLLGFIFTCCLAAKKPVRRQVSPAEAVVGPGTPLNAAYYTSAQQRSDLQFNNEFPNPNIQTHYSSNDVEPYNYKRSQYYGHDGEGEGGGPSLNPNVGNAIGVAGLGLLFIGQIATALNAPFLIPILLFPLAGLIAAALLIPPSMTGGGGGAVG